MKTMVQQSMVLTSVWPVIPPFFFITSGYQHQPFFGVKKLEPSIMHNGQFSNTRLRTGSCIFGYMLIIGVKYICVYIYIIKKIPYFFSVSCLKHVQCFRFDNFTGNQKIEKINTHGGSVIYRFLEDSRVNRYVNNK